MTAFLLKIAKMVWGLIGPTLITHLVESVKNYLKDQAEKRQKIKEMKDALKSDDTIKIEEALGNDNAGQPTKHNIPELRTRKKED